MTNPAAGSECAGYNIAEALRTDGSGRWSVAATRHCGGRRKAVVLWTVEISSEDGRCGWTGREDGGRKGEGSGGGRMSVHVIMDPQA